MTPIITVIIATRNRSQSLLALLDDLDTQALSPELWNVVVVDDGSSDPVAPLLAPRVAAGRLRHTRTEGVGQSAARQRACTLATGEVLVFLDDDMRVAPEFLSAHLRYHLRTPRAVVLGRIDPAPGLERMPLFERYHARQLERWHEAMRTGADRPRGVQLCMGNVSMTRADFEQVGGFDASLRRSEDRELGVRLELSGCALVFGDDAASTHCSDHDRIDVWLQRAYLYGRYDLKIARKHPAATDADPWRFWSLVHPLSKPVLWAVRLVPSTGRPLARLAYRLARLCDRVGLRSLAVTGTAMTYAAEYFHGLRDEERETARGPIARCLAAIREDHTQLQRVRRKYHNDSGGRLGPALVQKVGLQMLASYRVMRCLDELRVPVAPMVISRLIRHVYGAEIHWRARLAPGVSIVHGTGLVISHAADVGPGCILFQGVTLGESVDPVTGAIGAPRLEADVHIGPGASLLGPIVVGAESKVGAGAVLMRSVPARSLVMPPVAAVTTRGRGRARQVTRAAAALA